ncbi:endogenous retrovirus group K member 10 Gag polyprotein-like [Carettochelys insculpta]|uniref:endogenous retrovirus group K member 10 Gag polyprotein-like n=1 Tax=Carettochelys insculpta TaxID=44489 RepID=UPI003EB916C6
MGNSPSSYSSYIELLQTLLKSSGVKVKQSTFQKLFDLICKHCYWFTPSGKNALDLKQWRLIMRALRRAHQKGEIIPLPVWSLCNLVVRALEPLQSGSEEGCSLPPDSLAERGARRRVPKGDEALSEESGDSSEEGQEGQPITGDEKTGNSEQQKNYTARETSSGFFPANVCVAQPEPDFPPSTPSPLPPPTKEEGPSAPPFSCYGKDELFAEPPRQTVTEPVTNLMRTVLAVGAHEGFDLSPLTLSAFPVTIQQVPPNRQFPQGAINYHHEPLTFKLLKDLKQACVQYGVNSPYTFGLVQGLSQAERLIPWDWEILGRTVLNGAEFLQFKTWWHDEAALTARRNASQNPPVAITLEQLTGTGAWFGIQAQLQYNDVAIVQVRLCCLKAWEKIAKPGESTPSFVKVKQSAQEPYVDFIARLKGVLDKTVSQPELKELLLQMLSFDNANGECQRTLRPLKCRGASLDEYIKACNDIGSDAYKMGLLAAALKGDGSYQSNQNMKCFECGKPGHLKRNCRQGQDRLRRNQRVTGNDPANNPPGICPRCQKGRHWATQCHSRYHRNGTPLFQSGNFQAGPTRGPQVNNTGSSRSFFPVSSGPMQTGFQFPTSGMPPTAAQL